MIDTRDLILSLLIIIIVGGYAYWNSKVFIEGPTVTITSPAPSTRIEAPLILEGKVQLVDEILINDRIISITPERTFREVIALPKGYNEIEIKTRSRDGREKTTVISYIIE